MLAFSIKWDDSILFQLSIFGLLVLFGSFGFSYINFIGITLDRETPDQVYAKEPFDIQLNLNNSKRAVDSFFIMIFDSLHHSDQKGSFLYSYVPSKETMTQKFKSMIPRRGEYYNFTINLASHFPFGFFSHSIECSYESPITVFPSPMDQVTMLNILKVRNGQASASLAGDKVTVGDFRGLSPFYPGASIKMIHWPASIRTGELVIREMEASHLEASVLIVHSLYPSRGSKKNSKSFEKLLQFIVSYSLYSSSISTEFILAASFFDWEPIYVKPGTDDLLKVLTLLASAKEKREGDATPLKNVCDSFQYYKNVAAISNVPKENWEYEVGSEFPSILCSDMTGAVE
ncbi:MAG: hypothetical protein COA79_24625 [Planctomycetota bacterium]|nr:MAG: hypothetical protein COA79_24625 [Planctomycetota bacterium]